MGHSSAICAISKLPITCGDLVYKILVENTRFCSNQPAPSEFPLYGKYNDYGDIEGCDRGKKDMILVHKEIYEKVLEIGTNYMTDWCYIDDKLIVSENHDFSDIIDITSLHVHNTFNQKKAMVLKENITTYFEKAKENLWDTDWRENNLSTLVDPIENRRVKAFLSYIFNTNLQKQPYPPVTSFNDFDNVHVYRLMEIYTDLDEVRFFLKDYAKLMAYAHGLSILNIDHKGNKGIYNYTQDRDRNHLHAFQDFHKTVLDVISKLMK